MIKIIPEFLHEFGFMYIALFLAVTAFCIYFLVIIIRIFMGDKKDRVRRKWRKRYGLLAERYKKQSDKYKAKIKAYKRTISVSENPVEITKYSLLILKLVEKDKALKVKQEAVFRKIIDNLRI